MNTGCSPVYDEEPPVLDTYRRFFCVTAFLVLTFTFISWQRNIQDVEEALASEINAVACYVLYERLLYPQWFHLGWQPGRLIPNLLKALILMLWLRRSI